MVCPDSPCRLDAEFPRRIARPSICASPPQPCPLRSDRTPCAATRPTRKPRPRRDDRSGCLSRCAASRVGVHKEMVLQTTMIGTPEGFPQLGVDGTMLAALARAGFHEPSPVQIQLIPPA